MLRKRVFVFGFAPTKGHGWEKRIPYRNPSNDANFLGKENKQRKAHGGGITLPSTSVAFRERKEAVGVPRFLLVTSDVQVERPGAFDRHHIV